MQFRSTFWRYFLSGSGLRGCGAVPGRPALVRSPSPSNLDLAWNFKQTVEPVFGIIKAGMRFRQFLLRGLKAVRGEWSLVTMAWNIRRMAVLKG